MSAMSGKAGRLQRTPPPDPAPEQLAEWRTLVERVQADDESGLAAWAEDEDQDAGAVAGAAYRVLATQRTLEQLAAAPPAIRGHVAGILAVLRVDPVVSSVAFAAQLVGEVTRALLAGETAALTYQVVVWRQLVILLDLTVGGRQAPTPSLPATPAK